MPPKRGHVGGSSAKTPTQHRTKRTRRVNTPVASNALVGTQTATAAVALTGLKDPSHFNSENVDPSPHCSDANNELIKNDDGALLPIQTSLMAHNMETASFTNAVSSSALEAQRQVMRALPIKAQLFSVKYNHDAFCSNHNP